MRIVRYQTGDSKKAKYGWLLGDKVGDEGWGFLEDFNFLKGSIGLSIAF